MKKMSIVERLDLLLSLRTEDMDLEHSRKSWKNDEKNLYRWMEEEAEPEGGPVSDMYADKITHVQNMITEIDIKRSIIQKRITELEEN
jgi:23S rRNA G2069 N7-methylase RlmK/C1962 C5-methylase RlmI